MLNLFQDKAGLFIQIKIPFQGPLMPSSSLSQIKLDFSREEIIGYKPERLALIPDYSDPLDCSSEITYYSLYEIFFEKLRALVQRMRPRDLYDVIHLQEFFQFQGLDKELLNNIAQQKFQRHEARVYFIYRLFVCDQILCLLLASQYDLRSLSLTKLIHLVSHDLQ